MLQRKFLRAAKAVCLSRVCGLTTTTHSSKKRMLSGIQPSGSLHLGNYLGAIRQWVDLQDNYESYFFVVDLHAITSEYDPATLEENTLKAAALYLASGIDPSKSKIFIQSHVPAHSELTWLLSCITPQGWLQRMTQYKDKVQKRENVADAPLGLFSYPVLMTADILLYQAEFVPVGEDQLQHLELARDIAKRFNHKYCRKTADKVFRPPRGLTVELGSRVMSLTDGKSKMSKSTANDSSRINILDPPDVIAAKIKKCKTDAFSGLSMDDERRPECKNLLGIYQAVTDRSDEQIRQETGTMSWGEFKPLLTEAVVERLAPIQKNYTEIIADPAYLHGVLADGRTSANDIANSTLLNVRKVMGFSAPK